MNKDLRKLLKQIAEAPPEEKQRLTELFKELYRNSGAELAGPDDPTRYELVEDVERIDDDVELVANDDVEVVGDSLEPVEDDEYVGQRIVRRIWPKDTKIVETNKRGGEISEASGGSRRPHPPFSPFDYPIS